MRRILIILGILFALIVVGLMSPNFLTYSSREIDMPLVASTPPPPPAPPPPPEPSGSGSLMIHESRNTDEILKQLKTASMVFIVPDHANIKDTITVQLLIDPSKSLDEIVESVTVNGVKTTKRIQISKIVEATLTAPDFKIDAVTPEQQAITSTQPTEWLWKLTPESAGSHEVSLSVVAIVDVGDKSAMHHIKTYEQNVIVDIKATQMISSWVEKYWQWLFSTLIIPLAVWFYKNKFKKS